MTSGGVKSKPAVCEREYPSGHKELMPGVTFILDVYRDGDARHLDADESFDVAVVTISQDYARELIGYMDVLRGLSATTKRVGLSLQLWGDGADFYNGFEVDDDEDIPEDAEPLATEYDRVMVSDSLGVRFYATPDGLDDGEVFTEAIDREELEKIAAMPYSVAA
jgi:hypothetical protein